MVAAGTRRPIATVAGMQDFVGRGGTAVDHAGLCKVIARVFREGYVKESDFFTFTFDFQVGSRLSIVQLAKINAYYLSTPELSEITNLIEYIDICVGIIIPYFYGSTPVGS